MIFLLFFLFASASQLNLDGSQLVLTPAFRTYPFGGGIETTGRVDKLLWDHRNDGFYKYGFAQARIQGASYGLVEGGVSLFPISFFEIFAGAGFTQRYYGSAFVDCEVYACRGRVTRSRTGVRFLGGTSDFFVLAQYQRVWTKMSEENQKPILEELEIVEIEPSGEPLDASLVFLTARYEKNYLGLILRQAKTLQKARTAQAQYLALRVIEGPTSYILGAGRFESSVVPSGVSLFVIMSYTLGKSLSFF